MAIVVVVEGVDFRFVDALVILWPSTAALVGNENSSPEETEEIEEREALEDDETTRSAAFFGTFHSASFRGSFCGTCGRFGGGRIR